VARKKRGRPISGWLVLDKPEGVTATRATGMVRRIFDAQKAGHAGTLDPLASGILPIALGEGTKTVPYAMEGRKIYRFTAAWGEARETDDREGRVTAESQARPGEAEIRAALPRFTGVIDQRPPAYSAIKVEGERAYALARAGGILKLFSSVTTPARLNPKNDVQYTSPASAAVFVGMDRQGN
jgi:tRNA pseudouridine55 synthase